MLKRSICVFIFSFLAVNVSIQAEIQKILLKWDAALCLDVCIPRLQANIQSIPGVSDFAINPYAGVAEINWRAGVPFSFSPFNTATRATGIRMSDIRLRVNGTVAHDATSFYIISLGDYTRFQLIGPIRPEPGQYTVIQNIATHPLSPQVQQGLLNAEATGQPVIVEGPLFEPFRYNLILTTEEVKLPQAGPAGFNPTQLGR